MWYPAQTVDKVLFTTKTASKVFVFRPITENGLFLRTEDSSQAGNCPLFVGHLPQHCGQRFPDTKNPPPFPGRRIKASR